MTKNLTYAALANAGNSTRFAVDIKWILKAIETLHLATLALRS
jgi:hypothetical protein